MPDTKDHMVSIGIARHPHGKAYIEVQQIKPTVTVSMGIKIDPHTGEINLEDDTKLTDTRSIEGPMLNGRFFTTEEREEWLYAEILREHMFYLMQLQIRLAKTFSELPRIDRINAFQKMSEIERKLEKIITQYKISN